MNYYNYTIVITYVMAALGLASVALVENVDHAFVVAAALGAAMSLVLNILEKKVFSGKTGSQAWNIIAVGLLAYFLADYIYFSTDLLMSATRFLTILVVLKLFDLKTTRDYLLVYSLTFLQLLAAAASTISPLFFIIIALFIIAVIWALVVFNLKRDWEESDQSTEIPRGVFGSGFCITIIGVSSLSLIITLSLFFIIPRIGVGYLQKKVLDSVKISGFSDTVELGAIGEVKADPAIVMRVEFPKYTKETGPPPGAGYLRGTTLTRYDGKSWSKEQERNILLREDYNGVFRLPGLGLVDPSKLLEHTIVLEPLATEVLFAASYPVKLSGMTEGFTRNLWVDSSGSVYLPSPPYSRLQYKVWSYSGVPRTEMARPDARFIDTSYIDSSTAAAKIEDLVSVLTEGKPGTLEKARAMETYLKNGYRYTLSPKAGNSGDPLADFLFNTREGFCEHFATAYALMLRKAGIPSRMVTGFVMTEWNSFGGYYIIRKQDAHTWVEAYLDGLGWQAIDPTPPAGRSPFYKPSQLTLYLDLLKWRWNRYIIQFSMEDQKKMAAGIEATSTGVINGVRGRLRGAGSRASGYVMGGVAAALIVLLAYLLVKARYGERGRKAKTPRYYSEMLRILRKKGFVKDSSETPMEFASRVDRLEVVEVTRIYQKERYGGVIVDATDVEKVRGCIERLGRR